MRVRLPSLTALGSSSAPTAKAATVPAAAGAVYSITRLLGSTSTLALLSGSSSNLSLSGTTISAAAAIAAGASQTAYVRESTAAGLAVEYPVVITGAVVLTAPAAPALTVVAGNGQNTLSWTDGANGGSAITQHGLYRGTASGGEVFIGWITSGSPYVDTGLTNGAAYYYRLSAFNTGNGEGAKSGEASGTPRNASATFDSLTVTMDSTSYTMDRIAA